MSLRRNIVLSIAAIVLVCSFFMPNGVAGIMDSRRLDNLTIIDTQRFNFEVVSELSLMQRIALAASTSAEIMAIETGQVMEMEAAGSMAVSELVRFIGGSGIAVEASEYVVQSGSAVFVIDSADPSVNMIMWDFTLSDNHSSQVTLTIDDETGVILKMIYQSNADILSEEIVEEVISGSTFFESADPSGDVMRTAALVLTEMMTAYYGRPVSLTAYELAVSGTLAYYMAELRGDGVDTPMFGVIRANGFTMNERT